MVGYFVNPVVLRADSARRSQLRRAAGARARRRRSAALAHQDYPFPLLVERLQPERDAGRSPAVPGDARAPEARRRRALAGLAAFALGEAGRGSTSAACALESVPLAERRAQFDLTLMAAEVGRGSGARRSSTTPTSSTPPRRERMLGHFADAARRRRRRPGSARHLRRSLLPAAERAQAAGGWNAPAATRPREPLLHELFAAQAARTPGRGRRCVCGEESLTYGELDRRANRLAGRLRALGVGPEVRVASAWSARPSLVVALLAVLKAGGAYVPLDPAYPAERLGFMLEDSGAPVVLTRPER